MIVFDVSVVVGAALKRESVPERALLHARRVDVFALSIPIYAEMNEVLARPKFVNSIPFDRVEFVMAIVRDRAVWFEPRLQVTECRDAKDNKYLELALAASAEIIVSSDDDLLVLDPWRGIRVLTAADYLARS